MRKEPGRRSTCRRADRDVIRIEYTRPDLAPCELAPAEHFSDEPAPRRLRERAGALGPEGTGRRSSAVEGRFLSSCAGWKVPPTAEELYEAIRAGKPSKRQETVLRTWLLEATWVELLDAWVQQVYTWRELATAMHRIGYDEPILCHAMNELATGQPIPGPPIRG